MRTRNQGVSRLKKNPSGKYGSSRACEFGLGFSCACGFGLGFSCDGWASRSEVQFWVQRSQGFAARQHSLWGVHVLMLGAFLGVVPSLDHGALVHL